MFLMNHMDVQTELLDQLWGACVLELDEKIEIDQLTLPTKRCEKLLSAMRRKTLKQYEIFLDALTATNQSHVADVLRLEGSLLVVCYAGRLRYHEVMALTRTIRLQYGIIMYTPLPTAMMWDCRESRYWCTGWAKSCTVQITTSMQPFGIK